MPADVEMWAALEAKGKPRRKGVTVGKARAGAPSERAVQREIIKAGAKLGIWCVAVPNGSHLAGDPEERMRKMAAMRADGLHDWAPVIGALWGEIVRLRARVAALEVNS